MSRRARRRPRRGARPARPSSAWTRPTATAPARSSPPGRWTRSTSSAAEPAGADPGHAAAGGRRVPHPVHGARRGGAARARRAASPRRPDPTAAVQRRRRGRRPSGAEVLRRLVARSPGRCAGTPAWPRCASSASPRVIELPPAGALVGLVKRELKGTATLALKTPDDLDAAAELIDEHAGATAMTDRLQPARRPSPGARILGLGSIQPDTRRHQRRPGQTHGHQRRVDPRAGRHRRAAHRRAEDTSLVDMAVDGGRARRSRTPGSRRPTSTP